jgi:hypothetical protein
VTQRGQDLRDKFCPVHFSIFLKKSQNNNKKKLTDIPNAIEIYLALSVTSIVVQLLDLGVMEIFLLSRDKGNDQ